MWSRRSRRAPRTRPPGGGWPWPGWPRSSGSWRSSATTRTRRSPSWRITSAGSRSTSWTCARRPSAGPGWPRCCGFWSRSVKIARRVAARAAPLTISVAIPVLNGERYLEEVLAAVRAQRTEPRGGDRGGGLRAHATARSRSPAPPEPRWWRYRRRSSVTGARATWPWRARSGELIAFLTQDSTPADEHWLAAHAAASGWPTTWAPRSALTCPRESASPLTKRLLQDFFHDFSPGGEPVVHRSGDHHLPLEQQLLHRPRGLGGDPVQGHPVRRGPGPGRGPPGRGLGQGVHARGPGDPLPRPRPGGGLPALLRRVPRAAGQRGPEVRGVGGPGATDRGPLGGRRPALPGTRGALARRPCALDRPERRAPHRARGVRRARGARRPPSRAAALGALARRPRRRSDPEGGGVGAHRPRGRAAGVRRWDRAAGLALAVRRHARVARARLDRAARTAWGAEARRPSSG